MDDKTDLRRMLKITINLARVKGSPTLVYLLRLAQAEVNSGRRPPPVRSASALSSRAPADAQVQQWTEQLSL